MADVFQRLIAQFPSARGEIQAEWGSIGAAESRLLIRKSMATALGVDKANRTLENLNALPKLPDWNISVSHTVDLGGWVAVPRLYSVGFDIEIRERLKREVLERISKLEEISSAPDPVFLWAAKEACFKAMAGASQPATISEITIQGWAPQFSLWTYSSQSTRGKGWIGSDATRIYALFVI